MRGKALFACACLLLLGAWPAAAGVDVDFGVAVHFGNEADLFLAISANYFDRDRDEVRKWHAHFADPDDLAVALFIARHARRDLAAIYALRQRGLAWWEIGIRFGVPVDVWFVPVAGRPGPPFGRAYGYWKQHGKHPQLFRLSDEECRHLVAVRVVHEYYGVAPDVAMRWRAEGRKLDKLLAEEYHRRHPKAHHGGASVKPGGHGKGPKHRP